ncbi:MAG: T9SS type A sorting domain-containing protein [Saprospiraceae bacterium]|nr:T9SS type A sorting domain-containing protein [Saprospiraceae bacterium]
MIRSHLVQQADGNIIIFDSNGKLVRELKFGKTDRLQIEAPKQTGAYLVFIKSDNGNTESARLIVD